MSSRGRGRAAWGCAGAAGAGALGAGALGADESSLQAATRHMLSTTRFHMPTTCGLVRCAASIYMLLHVASCKSSTADHAAKVRHLGGGSEEADVSFAMTAHEAPAPVTLSELVARGHHWRLDTKHGPVHVWAPGGYDPKRAETIVYVHGYYVHIDDAWQNYHLGTQFASSAINALFIAPEAPSGPGEQVSWDSLDDLLDTVQQGLGDQVPRKRVVTVGHSAAYRTLLGWLDEPVIDTVVLVDAAYGEIDQYKKWVLATEDHRLIDIGDDTREWTDKLHAELPDSYVLDQFPSVEDGLPREAAHARIVYIKSNLGHFPLVTGGVALPMILSTLRAKRLVRQPLAEILDSPAD
jgi:hypothetical protein